MFLIYNYILLNLKSVFFNKKKFINAYSVILCRFFGFVTSAVCRMYYIKLTALLGFQIRRFLLFIHSLTVKVNIPFVFGK